MTNKTSPRLAAPFIATCLLLALSGALYLPFLHNPLLFDDETFFYTIPFVYYATTPIGLALRVPAYFTLAFTQVTWGSYPVWQDLSVHRIISLFFHGTAVLALFRLIHDLLCTVKPGVAAASAMPAPAVTRRDASLLAFAGAAMFAAHP
jgi:hypothetical protein